MIQVPTRFRFGTTIMLPLGVLAPPPSTTSVESLAGDPDHRPPSTSIHVQGVPELREPADRLTYKRGKCALKSEKAIILHTTFEFSLIN